MQRGIAWVDGVGSIHDGDPLCDSVTLEVKGGNATVKFVAGVEAAMVERTVNVGLGESPCFDLRGFENVRLDCLSVQPATEGGTVTVYALFRCGQRSYSPYRFHVSYEVGATLQVPRGATGFILSQNDAGAQWEIINRGSLFFTGTYTAGTAYRVLGDFLVPSGAGSITWLLEPV